jgi:ubiquinone/menaquinone biosynthesis C-methylase UbiE
VNTVAAEIGVGGGRIASRVAPRVKSLVAFDISEEMLKRAKAALTAFGIIISIYCCLHDQYIIIMCWC